MILNCAPLCPSLSPGNLGYTIYILLRAFKFLAFQSRPCSEFWHQSFNVDDLGRGREIVMVVLGMYAVLWCRLRLLHMSACCVRA
jgi:hypothetical protein